MGWEDVVGALPERWKVCVTADGRIGTAGDAAGVGRGAAEGEPSGYKSILALLGEDPIDIDHVIERSGLGAGRVSAALLELELEGRVRQIEGKRFVRIGRG